MLRGQFNLVVVALACAFGPATHAQTAKREAVRSSTPVTQMIVKLRALDSSERVSGMRADRAVRLSNAIGKSMTPLRAMSGDASVLRLAQAMSVDEAQALAQQIARGPGGGMGRARSAGEALPGHAAGRHASPRASGTSCRPMRSSCRPAW